MDVVLEAGSVVYNAHTGTKYVIRRQRGIRPDEVLVADYPHADGDYSYGCGSLGCSCGMGPARVGRPVSRLTDVQRFSDVGQRHAEMADVVRVKSGHRLIDCLQAVRATKDVDAAINWLRTHTKNRPLYRSQGLRS